MFLYTLYKWYTAFHMEQGHRTHENTTGHQAGSNKQNEIRTHEYVQQALAHLPEEFSQAQLGKQLSELGEMVANTGTPMDAVYFSGCLKRIVNYLNEIRTNDIERGDPDTRFFLGIRTPDGKGGVVVAPYIHEIDSDAVIPSLDEYLKMHHVPAEHNVVRGTVSDETYSALKELFTTDAYHLFSMSREPIGHDLTVADASDKADAFIDYLVISKSLLETPTKVVKK